jgi:hypothetical protein
MFDKLMDMDITTAELNGQNLIIVDGKVVAVGNLISSVDEVTKVSTARKSEISTTPSKSKSRRRRGRKKVVISRPHTRARNVQDAVMHLFMNGNETTIHDIMHYMATKGQFANDFGYVNPRLGGVISERQHRVTQDISSTLAIQNRKGLLQKINEGGRGNGVPHGYTGHLYEWMPTDKLAKAYAKELAELASVTH